MVTFLFILVVLVCLLLMGVVLVQNSKGGGLSADFSSSNQYMGVRKTADFLEKATWGMAIALFVLCLLTTAVSSGDDGAAATLDSEMAEIADEYAIGATVNPAITPPTPDQGAPTGVPAGE